MRQRLPPALFHALRVGTASARRHVLVLQTVDPAGYPHTALLCEQDVYAATRGVIVFAVWGTSQTAANLRRHPRATLALVEPAGVYYIKGRTQPIHAPPTQHPETTVTVALFRFEVQHVRRDAIKGAGIIQGLDYRESTEVALKHRQLFALVRQVAQRGARFR